MPAAGPQSCCVPSQAMHAEMNKDRGVLFVPPMGRGERNQIFHQDSFRLKLSFHVFQNNRWIASKQEDGDGFFVKEASWFMLLFWGFLCVSNLDILLWKFFLKKNSPLFNHLKYFFFLVIYVFCRIWLKQYAQLSSEILYVALKHSGLWKY